MVVVWIARVVAVVLFVIVMTLWATGVKWFVGTLSPDWINFGAGILVGMAISLIVERWDKYLQRKNAGNEMRGD